MKSMKMFERSRYNSVPKIYEDDYGFMVMPFCPTFTDVYSHVVQSHDTITGLALEYYGDTNYQWAILNANDLPFPPKLTVGTVVYIPSPDEVLSYDEDE